MKLKALSKKPKLIKAQVDNEKIVKKYGEAVEFWMYDRYEIDTYFKLMNVEEQDFITMSKVVKDMIYDEDGTPIVEAGEILPSDLLMSIVTEVIKQLGNLQTQTLEK
jgi:hypothetical protein